MWNLTIALVGIIEGIDINSLIDADGNFNTDALVTVFSTLDPTVVSQFNSMIIIQIIRQTDSKNWKLKLILAWYAHLQCIKLYINLN